MCICDEKMLRFLAVNQAMVRQYGWSRAEFLRMTTKDICPAKEIPRFRATLKTQHSTSQYRRKDGSLFDAEVNVSPIEFAGRPARLVLVTDITLRKRVEAELHRSRDLLEQRVLVRTAGLRASQEKLARSEERFRQMAENVNEVFWLADANLRRMLYVSPAFEKIWGRPCAELYEKPRLWVEAVHPEDRRRVPAAFFRRRQGASVLQAEYRVVHPDGTIRWILDHCSPIRDKDGRVYRVAGAARDISQRKRAELALARANRALLALSQCNEAQLYAADEMELFREVCRIIVEVGGYKLAWVGLAEHNQQNTVRPVAHAGDAKRYLDKPEVTLSDIRRGRGPVGTAIRTRKIAILHDLPSNPRFAPWRCHTSEIGAVSAIGLPLLEDGQCLGALAIFASDPAAFDPKEVKLLTHLTNNLTFGVVALRMRLAHQRLERQVLEISEREQRRIGQDLHDSLGQRIGAARLTCAAVAHRLAKDNLPVASDVARVEQELLQALNETRQISRGLHPVRLGDDSLMAALYELAENITKTSGIPCPFICPKTVFVKDHTVATHLYRIAQEATNNAVRHANPKHIRVALHPTRTVGVLLRIEDDGCGLSPTAMAGSGLGLSIMRYRASLIGASIAIGQRRRRGTVVSCEWKPTRKESHAG